MTIDAASAVQNAKLSSQIGVRVARKALDVQQQQGDAAVALIKAAAESQKQAQAAGRVDVMA